MSTTAAVRLWGKVIGAVFQPDDSGTAIFEYEPAFVGSGIEVSPIEMPLQAGTFSFPELSHQSFRGLPGLLADSLPDRFGNALIDAWVGAQGRRPENFNAVERLCYVGKRGMGALEYEPTIGPRQTKGRELDVAALVELASEVLTQREEFEASLATDRSSRAVRDILAVGTSAGGARAKAVIAYNPATGAVRSGQVDAAPGFEYWVLKFDGVSGNKDKELEDPKGYCAIEYAYSLMSLAAGVWMTECRLLEEGGRRHFMTRRFDRLDDGRKLHMQSLGALAHLDYNMPGAHSYEEAFLVMRQLGLSSDAREQMFRRSAFNVVARNQDDHVKNIAFLMQPDGRWSLAPAYDLTYSFNPQGSWTRRHQMSINGKTDGFEFADFEQLARTASMKRGRAAEIFQEVGASVARWPEFAAAVGIASEPAAQIGQDHRLFLAPDA